MNNTYFIILLQEICNTWNRMQYAVYLCTWRTQGASVASVCVARREGKKREEETSSCDSWQSINLPEQLFSQLRHWMQKLAMFFGWMSKHLSKECNIFIMSVSALLSDTTYWHSLCQHTFSINVCHQKLCNLLWHFGCLRGRITQQHLVLHSYTTTQNQKFNISSEDPLCGWIHTHYIKTFNPLSDVWM